MNDRRHPLFTALLALLLSPALLLGGCVTQPPRGEEAQEEARPVAAGEAPEEIVGETGPQAEFTPELLYELLVAEIAGQRDRFDVAVANYLEAARNADDPVLARRATRIAFFAKNDAAALEAARRWSELDPEESAAHKTIAVLAVRNGAVDEAVGHLERLIELAPGDDTYDMIAKLMGDEHPYSSVLEVMARLQAAHADNPRMALAHAEVAFKAKANARALEQVDLALKLKPDWGDARVQRARILIALERGDEALDDLGAALAERPDDNQLRLAYARLLIKARKLEGAKKQFKLLVKRAPKDPELLYALSLLALEAEQWSEAKEYLERLLATGKRPSETHYYLGLIAEEQGETGVALDHYQQVEGGDYYFNALLKRVDLLVTAGRVDEARAILSTLRGEKPDLAPRLYQAEGNLLADQGDREGALALYDQALGEFPGDVELLYARGMTAERLGRLDLMERDMRAIIKEAPDNAQALNALGYTLADRTDRHQEALELIERAFALAPEDPAVIDSMGWVNFRLGRYEEALTHLRKAYEGQKDPEIAAHLAEVLWAMGRKQEARSLMEEAAAGAPDHAVLKSTMERLLR